MTHPLASIRGLWPLLALLLVLCLAFAPEAATGNMKECSATDTPGPTAGATRTGPMSPEAVADTLDPVDIPEDTDGAGAARTAPPPAGAGRQGPRTSWPELVPLGG